MSSSTTAPLTVRTITADEHLAFLRSRRSASFLQTPAWGRVKSEWVSESIGWFRDASSLGSSTQGHGDASSLGSSTQGHGDASSLGSSTTGHGGDELVGAALVLYRQLPKVKRYLAYLPEGPVIDWAAPNLAVWLAPMVTHLRKAGAFGVRMGPPVVTARWSAAQVKEGIASDDVRRLGEVAPLEREQVGARVVSQLDQLGWKQLVAQGGFAAGQPQYNFVIPLRHDDGSPRTEDEVLKGMNQLWRRNIKKAAKMGVEVTRGEVVSRRSQSDLLNHREEQGNPTHRDEQSDPTSADDLAAFHALYVHTAERDGFTPRPLSYFRTMAEALSSQGEASEFRLYLARHEGDLVAATIWIRVGGHTWYSYGASSTEKREVRGSNAAQWAMIQDSLAAGADVYDLRGITDTLDANDSHVGLIQFKVGTGGEAVEYAGEWDFAINRVIHKAFDLYMSRR